jgi:hypothetical protein
LQPIAVVSIDCGDRAPERWQSGDWEEARQKTAEALEREASPLEAKPSASALSFAIAIEPYPAVPATIREGEPAVDDAGIERGGIEISPVMSACWDGR